MLNATDPTTFTSLRELKRTIQNNKPLVYWIGAGASKWLGYPLWKELARQLRREFSRFVPRFDDERAHKLIQENSCPEFFQLCRDLDRQRYYRFLTDSFLPKPEPPLYTRFAKALEGTGPLHILTTNVDEALEQRFKEVGVYQRSDITRCGEQLNAGKPFLAKLHGSRSSIETTVFASEDYLAITKDSSYLSTLKHIFAAASVVFLGYSVSDEYLVSLLLGQERDMNLFGAGPHFVVSADFEARASLLPIRYSLERFPDHRAALSVLDIIRQVKSPSIQVSERGNSEARVPDAKTDESRTAYYISDLMPPGTWDNSLTIQMERKDGLRGEGILGLGFVAEELSNTLSTALHDIVIALICFDYVYFPLGALSKVHTLLGSESFWHLIDADITRYIHLQYEPGVFFFDNPIIGGIALASHSGLSAKAEVLTSIRRQIAPAPGKESVAERQIEELSNKVTIFDEGGKIDLAGLVRASALMPEVARLLGIGEAILPTQVPRWLTFSYLRLAHLVHTGAVCDRFGIQAAKIPFGGARLVSAAFGIQPASELADQYANYILYGRFSTDLRALENQPSIISSILRFRETAEGIAFRKEVRDQLLQNEASEFAVSVNAGLKRNLPIPVLERARYKFSSLLIENAARSPVPAVWSNSFQGDDSIWLWRKRSRALLSKLTKDYGLDKDDPCICGSGDTLRLCCARALEN